MTNEEYQEKIKTKFKGLIVCLSDYNGMKSTITLQCTVCNHAWTSRADGILHRLKKCHKCHIKGMTTTDEEFKEELKDISNNTIISLEPYQTTRIKIPFKCLTCGNIWKTTPKIIRAGHRCPACSMPRGERIVKDLLEECHIKYKPQATFKGLKDKRLLPIDFYLPEYNIAIEVDGRQHRNIVEYFGGVEEFETRKLHDSIKEEFFKRKQIPLIRLHYTRGNISNLNELLRLIND